MKAIELMDSWSASGTDYNEFSKTLTDLAQSTYIANLNTAEVTLMHYKGRSPDEPEKMVFTIHSAAQMAEKKARTSRMNIDGLKAHGVTDAFIGEFEDKAKLMMRMAGSGMQRQDFYFTSSHLSRDLAARASLAGDAVYEPTDFRDNYIMYRYATYPVDAAAVIRKNTKETSVVHKVFALPSSTYCPIDQRAILSMVKSLVDELGKFECRKWYIDHFITQLWLTFPEKAEDISKTYDLPDVFIPGVLLETSDTGDCSLRAIAFWEHKRTGHARIGMFEREHRGNIEVNEVVDRMRDRLMVRYMELPHRLCELLAIDISDPTAAVEKIFKMLHATKLLGKKRALNLQERIIEEISATTSMTGYEMAMLFMDLPLRYEGDDSSRIAIEEMAGRVPFLDFTQIAKSTTAVTLA